VFVFKKVAQKRVYEVSKKLGGVGLGLRINQLDFVGDLLSDLDQGILFLLHHLQYVK